MLEYILKTLLVAWILTESSEKLGAWIFLESAPARSKDWSSKQDTGATDQLITG